MPIICHEGPVRVWTKGDSHPPNTSARRACLAALFYVNIRQLHLLRKAEFRECPTGSKRCARMHALAKSEYQAGKDRYHCN
jgi:hypothetical protein